MLQRTFIICLLSSLLLSGCEATSDADLSKAAQCNNLRSEMWQIQSDPQKLKMNEGTRQYKNMRLDYGHLDCGDFRNYFRASR